MGLILGVGASSLVGLGLMFSVLQNTQSNGSNNGKVAGTTTGTTNTNTAAAPTAPAEDVVGTFRAVSNDEHVRGDKNAKLTIIEYSDLECPFCKRFHPTMLKIADEYKGKVKWVYRHFPLSSLHPKAPKEAEATECAFELGGNDKFWEFTDMVYDKTPGNNGLDAAELPKFAKEIGLNETKFKECLDSGKYAKKVQDDYADATSAGGQGTPYSILVDAQGGKTAINGAQPYESVKALIDSKL